ncbi:MAG TPA: HAD-IB family phosphatase [Longimicrobiales bacterium]
MPAEPRFRTVLFDCDSTLSTIEGVDELARDHPEVRALTEAAMRGEVPLEEVYGRRLEIVRPSREAVEALGRRYIETMVPGAREAVSALLAAGVRVRVISAGLRPAVVTLARVLGLGDDDVAAVDIYFSADGAYAGYDAASPLARSGGKRAVVEEWLPELPRPILMVGDGATDLEVQGVADCFAAFAGVVARPAVIEAADEVIRGRSLLPVLDLVFGAGG